MIFLDAHVHSYEEYDSDILFDSFIKNAARYAPENAGLGMVVLLRAFQSSLSSLLGSLNLERWHIEAPAKDGDAFVATDGKYRIALFSARQVAALERIELLGFFGDSFVEDGLPLRETASRLRSQGYTPVIAWGKGKWLFKRAKLVKSIIEEQASLSPLPLIGDSALRPSFWCEPLYKLASGLGLKFVYGSDPLPGAGNERNAGRYATLIDAPMTYSCREMLDLLCSAEARPCGKRFWL